LKKEDHSTVRAENPTVKFEEQVLKKSPFKFWFFFTTDNPSMKALDIAACDGPVRFHRVVNASADENSDQV